MWYIIIIGITLCVTVLFFSSCSQGLWNSKEGVERGAVSVVAHRAGAGLAPENSLAAVDEALAVGADVVEVDVHLTADGELVVCHDNTIERTTNGKGRIGEMTLEEIRAYRIVTADGAVTEEPLPTLGDVLWRINGRCRVLVEVKRTKDAERMAKAIINEVALYQADGWVAVQSFDTEVLAHIHRLGHPFTLEKLFYFKVPFLPFAYDGSLTRFNFSKYDYISSFNFHYKYISPRLVKKIHSCGKSIKVWTLDGPKESPMLPVDAVITDRPDLWKR